jgi:hypothetical protein
MAALATKTTSPPTQSTQSDTSHGAAAPVGTTAQVDTVAHVPAPAARVPVGPTIPVTTPVGECFVVNLANNPFAALAPPSPVCDPNTFSSILPAETLNSDFTLAFAASQGIVTPSNHSNQYVIGYLCYWLSRHCLSSGVASQYLA